MTHHSASLARHLGTLPERMTPAEVALFLRVTEPEVIQWIEAGQLGGYRLPDRWLIFNDDLENFLTNPQLTGITFPRIAAAG